MHPNMAQGLAERYANDDEEKINYLRSQVLTRKSLVSEGYFNLLLFSFGGSFAGKRPLDAW